MRRLAAALAIATSTFAAACSLSLEGYTNGAAPRVEAGASDASAAPDVTPPDGGSEAAAPEVDAAAPNAALDCTGAFFCDGFERADLLGGWDTKAVDSSSSLAITAGLAHTGRSSLRASLGTGTNAAAQLEKTLVAFSQLDYSFSIYRETGVTGINAMTILWEPKGTNAYAQLYLALDTDGAAMVEQAFDATGTQTTFSPSSTAPFPGHVWVPGLIHVDFVAKTYTATFNGTVIANKKILIAAYPTNIPRVQVGSGYASVQSPSVFDLDDIVVRITP